MISHNVVEVSNSAEMWEEHDGTRQYVVHGRQPSPFCRGMEIVDFAGAGIINGRYVRNLDDAKKAMSVAQTQGELFDILASARGSLTVHAFNHATREYFILNDPLGGGQIYLADHAGRIAAASDLTSLVDLYKIRNSPLKKDIHYFITEALTYTQTHGADTPYVGVELLRRGECARISSSGVVTRLCTSPPENLYFSEMSYGDGLQAFVQNMLENVEKASEQDFDLRVSHLTGGFDSRLVLAAIMKAGVADDFLYYCIKLPPDYEVSKSLAGHLGLRHTSSNDGNPRGRGYQRDYFEYIKNSPRASQLVLAEGIDFRFSPQNNLVFQGGYGELARTFNSTRWDGNSSRPYDLAYSLWRWLGFPSQGEAHASIWAQDYLDVIVQRLSGDIQRFKDLGLSDDYFTNYFYIEKRNRLFIGARTYYANFYRSQFDPIYSPHLASLPTLLDFNRRRANFVGIDAMMAMCPALASLPFDSEKIGDLYRQERSEILPLSFNGRDPKNIDLPNHLTHTIMWEGEPAVISDGASAAAKKLGLPEIVMHGIEMTAPKVVDRVGQDLELQRVLNFENLTDMLRPIDGLTRERATHFHKIISAFVLADLV